MIVVEIQKRQGLQELDLITGEYEPPLRIQAVFDPFLKLADHDSTFWNAVDPKICTPSLIMSFLLHAVFNLDELEYNVHVDSVFTGWCCTEVNKAGNKRK